MEGKRQLKAVVEADVVGYSQLVARDEWTTSKMLQDRRVQIENYTWEFQGNLVNQAGDAFLLTFDSALNAVKAARAIQLRYKDQHKSQKYRNQMHFRIGVDLGDVIQDWQGQPVGNAVNTAARLEALADPGGICVSGPVYNQVHNRVPLKFEDMGERPLKNIPIPVRVFKASVYKVQKDVSNGKPKTNEKSTSYIPKIKKKPTESDWNQFFQKSFSLIRDLFQKNLTLLKRQNEGMNIDYNKGRDRMLNIRISGGGAQETGCIIWFESRTGLGAKFFYSRHGLGLPDKISWKISLTPALNQEHMALWATGTPIGSNHDFFDLECLSPGEAAEYLWRLFAQNL